MILCINTCTQSVYQNGKECWGQLFEINDVIMAYTCLIVLDPEIPFTLPEMKGISGTDGANYKVIK